VCPGKGERTIKKPRLLIWLSIVLLACSAVLFVLSLLSAENKRVLTVDEIRAMPATGGSYRSINNWKTVETTSFKGVPMSVLLIRCGVKDDSAHLKIIAPDGYFWPAVGTTLTPVDMARSNSDSLVPILAYSMNGKPLDPEPDGSGPLRYVAPQYKESDTNKPSWVSNVRLIEVGPVPKGTEVPDSKEVPAEEVWIYGKIPARYRINLYIPAALGIAGLISLMTGLIMRSRERRPGKNHNATTAALLVLLLLVGCIAGLSGSSRCLGQSSPVVFSAADLLAMPAFSGRYTFLKQQPPYTYYESDYTGVPLSYILGERLSLVGGASGVVVRATDGYTATLSMEQVNKTYPGNLKVIIAYAENGGPLTVDEGPLRLIVPQTKPGNRDSGGDPNTPLCARMIFAVEVSPVPAGVSPPAAGSVPPGSLAFYGSVQAPAAPVAPAPQPTQPVQQASTAPQAATSTPVTAQQQANKNPANALFLAALSGRRGLFAWVFGATLQMALTGRMGRYLWLLYWLSGV
jgi:DMSO/TMAO reductase YedYZ molybdopterin-dependent catalytic subunit